MDADVDRLNGGEENGRQMAVAACSPLQPVCNADFAIAFPTTTAPEVETRSLIIQMKGTP